MTTATLQWFEVRYGKGEPFTVPGENEDAVWEQHFDTAFELGVSLSVRPASDVSQPLGETR